MDNSNMDLFLLFRDDPELLAILANSKAEDAPPTVEDAPRPTLVEPGSLPYEGVGAFEEPISPIKAEAEIKPPTVAGDENSWRTLMDELDQLLNTSIEPPKPELPPSLSGVPYDFGVPLPPPPEPITRAGLEDSVEPFVFEKTMPFDFEDPLPQTAASTIAAPTIDEQAFPFPYGDQTAEAFLTDHPEDEQLEEPPIAAKASTSKRVVSIVFNIVFFLLCLTLIVGSTVFAFSSDPQKNYLGYRFFNVMSNSMQPQPGGPAGGFVRGDIIVVKVINGDDIDKVRANVSVNDIITVRTDDNAANFLTHRVVNILSEWDGEEGLFFETKGDDNERNDPNPFASKFLVGKVVLVLPRTGSIVEYVRAHLALTIVFIFAFIAFGVLLRSLLLNNSNRKNNKTEKSREKSPRRSRKSV